MQFDANILEIEGWMTPGELEWLYQTAERLPADGLIVEIGAWMGRSSAALFLGADSKKRVVSIDNWEGSPDEPHGIAQDLDIYTLFAYNMRRLGLEVKSYEPDVPNGSYYLTGDSLEVLDIFTDASVDWLFYDGRHSTTGENIDAWLPKLKPNGLLTGHDYFCFYEDIQQEIHKRFYIHELHESIWVRYMGLEKPDWL
jgi:hypothetical protein